LYSYMVACGRLSWHNSLVNFLTYVDHCSLIRFDATKRLAAALGRTNSG